MMYLTNKVKEEIFKENGSSEKDSGSAEGQVALFTTRINHLTKHLKNNKKDNSGRRGLIMLVSQRRKLLSYVKKQDAANYKTLIEKLNIRK